MIPSRRFDVVCLCTQDWEGMWTRKQRFMREFARRGHKVLFVEFQLHWLSFFAGFRGANGFTRLSRIRHSPRLVEPNVYVATPPIVLPWYMRSNMINSFNKAVWVKPFVIRHIRRLGLKDFLLWVYPVDAAPLVGQLGETLTVFDCVDDWSTFEGKLGLVKKDAMWRFEQQLLRKADIVFTTAPKLYDTRRVLAKGETYLVPNAAEFQHFVTATFPDTIVPEDLAKLSRPRIGFLGSVQFWLDFDLLRFLALERPSWSFVFVGPVSQFSDVDKIRGLPNVHLLGKRSYSALPGYLKGFDVCLNPYKTGPLAEACSPLKLYEYLAAGRPIVSTQMPEACALEPHVRVGLDYTAFLRHVEESLADESETSARARLSLGSQHTWERRFDQVYGVVSAHMVDRGLVENRP